MRTRLREVQLSCNYNSISLVIPLKVQGVSTPAMVDTAAQVSIISEDLAKQLSPPSKLGEKVVLRGAGRSSNMIAQRAFSIPLEIGSH